MKCFGYSKKNPGDLPELTEVTFLTNPENLKRLAAFFVKCAEEIEGDPGWEHEHYMDHLGVDSIEVDVVVYNADWSEW